MSSFLGCLRPTPHQILPLIALLAVAAAPAPRPLGWRSSPDAGMRALLVNRQVVALHRDPWRAGGSLPMRATP